MNEASLVVSVDIDIQGERGTPGRSIGTPEKMAGFAVVIRANGELVSAGNTRNALKK